MTDWQPPLPPLPNIYKGIALFTPGGDLIYAIDPDKQAQWHSSLCLKMQNKWGLANSPHFLVPGYTATVERWLDPQTRQIKTIAEVYPAAQRYIPLLETLFELDPSTEWQIAPWQEEYCNRAIIETYKDNFPQLWLRQGLIVRLNQQPYLTRLTSDIKGALTSNGDLGSIHSQPEAYVLRLYISSDRTTAEATLSYIHKILEQGLTSPYTLKVIDVNKNSEQAAIDRVTITPTLVRVSPKPVKRIIGQFNNIERVLQIISSF